MRLTRVALGTVALGFVIAGYASPADKADDAQAKNDSVSVGGHDCAAMAKSAGREPDWYAAACLGGEAQAAPEEALGPVRVPGDTAFIYNVRAAGIPTGLHTTPLPTLNYTQVGASTALTVFAFDFDLPATTLWGVENNVPRRIGTFNQTTGVFTSVVNLTGSVPAAETITGLKFDPTSSLVYLSTNASLHTVNLTTGVATLVGTYNCIPGGAMIDIAISNTGVMFGNDIGLDNFISINKATAACTIIGPTGVPTSFAQGMDFDWSDNTLYAWMYTGAGANRLATINLTTGAATTIVNGLVGPENEGAVRVPFGTPPTINIADSSITEGNAGTTNQFFNVTLSASPTAPVTVNFTTAPGTATAPADYLATSGTLTFAPGTTSRMVTVSVVGELLDEANETYFVNLSAPSGGVIGDGQGVGTIIDDDGPTINAGDASITEGNAGTSNLMMPVSLSAPSPGQVTVTFATADGTATAGSDYTATSGTLTFAPGTTALSVTVSVIGDVTDELDENFFVNLSAPTGGAIGDGQGVGTIIDDDGEVADTTGELSHQFAVHGDLSSAAGFAPEGATGDTDTYSISQTPWSSWEVVVDAASGDISPVELDRRDGTTVIQTSLPIGTGTGRSLRWANDTSSAVSNQTVRVASGGCTTDCGADDTYRLRSYETTYSIPRFNNAGTQVTVLLLQNPTDYTITMNVYFWNASGTQLHVENQTLAPKNVLVLNTASIPAVNGQSGTVTVTHNGRFGDLAGKTVALEPATGFSFDSPMLTR